MFHTFISHHNSNFFSDKLVLTSVTPASSAPVLQPPKATSSTLYFVRLTVNAGNGGFLHCIQMDTSVNAANQVVSVGADIAFDADPKFFACLGDMDLAAKGLGAKEWNNSLKTKLSLLPKKLFRIRMSRNFGMKMLTMTNLST